MHTEPRAQSTERWHSDLDGLRALAVLPVVLYHAGANWLPGGFVGVDIFFVLSGFFITRQLVADIDQRRFSLWRFYERRARRILPALLIMLTFVTIAAVAILIPADLVSFAKSQLSTLAFASNVFFWRDSGYFAQAADLKPLLHTWSLAVEEQFYIALPPLLWFVSQRWRRSVPIILAALAFVSLCLCIWGAYFAPSASFYLGPTRAWELLCGALLAVVTIPKLSKTLCHTLSLAGLTLIGASLLMITDRTPFPGWAALGPCLGASLIVLSSLGGGGAGNALLKIRPAVFVGQISYSLYLWHWPPLAFAEYVLFRAPTPLESAALVAVAFVFAILSWRYIEQPFRGTKSRIGWKQLVMITGGGATVVAASAGLLIFSDGLKSRMHPAALTYLVNEPFPVPESCFYLSMEDVRASSECVLGAPNTRALFMIWGDSHANRMAMSLDAVGERRGYSGWQATKGSCPPLLDARWPLVGCRDHNSAVFARVSADETEIVILSALWANYAEGDVLSTPEWINFLTDGNTITPSVEENRRVFRRTLLHTVSALRNAGKLVMIIGPVPELEWSAPQRLATAAQFGSPRPTGPTLAQFLARQTTVLATLQELDTIEGVVVVYPHTALCDQNVCAVERNGRRLYFDDNHLDVAGSELIEPMIEIGLRQLTETSTLEDSSAHNIFSAD